MEKNNMTTTNDKAVAAVAGPGSLLFNSLPQEELNQK
jgi:hypothetical protein